MRDQPTGTTHGSNRWEGSRLRGYLVPLLLGVPAAVLFLGMRLDVVLVSAAVMLGVALVLSVVKR
jgi:hypothetical protein